MRLLSAPTKQALSDALLLLQTTVRNAETESADAELARMSGELDAMRAQLEQATSEHVKAVKVARATELVSSRLETKLAGAEAKIEYLRKESVYWQDEAKGWKENYTRVEEERRELATELRVVALSRSGADLTESSRKRRREERTVSSRAIGSPAATDPGSPQATRANSRTNNPAPSTKVKVCQNCDRNYSSPRGLRHGPASQQLLCPACWSYEYRHGVCRPLEFEQLRLLKARRARQ